MTVVADASVVVAALLAEGDVGDWAEAVVRSAPLVAPHLLPVEVAHVLRRSVLTGAGDATLVALAYQEFGSLPVQLVPYEPVAERVWELRDTVTPYDAWYVAIAEEFDLELATLDARLARAPGPRCRFLTPP